MKKEDKDCKIVPADRVNSVQEYYFSKKLKEVAEMNAAGKNVINLGIGSPDLPPSDETIETLCQHARNANEHGYQPYVGIPELREAFAGWYKKWYGVELNPKNEIQPLELLHCLQLLHKQFDNHRYSYKLYEYMEEEALFQFDQALLKRSPYT